MSLNTNSNGEQSSSAPEIISVSTSRLTAKHQADIEARGLYLAWAAASCESADIDKATIALGYPAKSSGILFVGANLQFQFRPDDPWASKEGGKFPPKYRSPIGEYDAFLPNHPTDGSYWEVENLKKSCWQIAGRPYLLITEGPFKAIAGCSNGLPTIGVLGVTMALTPKPKDGGGDRKLVFTLQKYADAGFGFIIAFDADAATNKNVRREERKLTEELSKWVECPTYSITGEWEPGENKETNGMDDFIQKNGIEAFTDILSKLEPEEIPDNIPDEIAQKSQTDSPAPKKSKNKQLVKKVREAWGSRLQFNEMSQQIEMEGVEDFDIELIYLQMAEELGIDVPKQTASDLVKIVAIKNAYSPVRDYLNSLAGVAPVDLDSLAKRYLGTDDPLHAKFLKNTLIAAVARAFEPGCQVDTTCILQGNQGLFKSRFWQTLASDPWFTDNLSEASEKDEKMKLRHSWILEYSEFESVYKRKEVSQLKSFLTSRVDTFRRPYGRSIEKFPRTSVFVGTTNRQEFLSDATGERRFLVITVGQPIPIKLVQEERDAVWAAAVAAYRNGQQWWLTPEEDKLLAEANKSWQASDTWETSILGYLENKHSTTVAELLTKVINLDLAEHKRAEQMRVADILRCNGWAKASEAKLIEGKRQRYWEKVVSGSGEVVLEVVSTQNPCSDSVVDTVPLPNTTFLPKNDCKIDDVTFDTVKKDTLPDFDVLQTFETRGSVNPISESQRHTEQELEPYTTSIERGSVTPSPSSTVGAKHKDFKKGDRVVVAYDRRSNFERATGTVIEVKGQEVMVGFDEPIRDTDFVVFNLAESTILMKLP